MSPSSRLTARRARPDARSIAPRRPRARATIAACDSPNAMNAPIANSGISRTVIPPKAISSTPAAAVSTTTPTVYTSRRPGTANARGRHPSTASSLHSRGKPTKLVLAESASTISRPAIATKYTGPRPSGSGAGAGRGTTSGRSASLAPIAPPPASSRAMVSNPPSGPARAGAALRPSQPCVIPRDPA